MASPWCSLPRGPASYSSNRSAPVVLRRREERLQKPDETPDLAGRMVAYQRGELSAFESIYRALAPRLRGYLVSLTRNAAIAEDLLQESFLQLHRSRHTYVPGRAVAPWAFSIARHVFLMDRRARARRSRVETPALEALPDIPVPPAVEKLATTRLVQEALAELNDDRREAVLLHHVFGFTFGEIGALLGIREGTAKLRAHRALHALRESLTRKAEPGR